MSKKNVCVLFGGRSVEHEISMITAIQYIEAMDRELYNVIPVYIAHSGKWYMGDKLLNKQFYRKLPSCLSEVDEVTLLPDPTVQGLTVVRSAASGLLSRFKKPEVVPVDVYVPAFHGTYGEDGCIQGLLELADAAYASCDVLSSAVAMNKYICKVIAGHHDVPVLPSRLVTRDEFRANVSETRTKVLNSEGLGNYPLFIKPVHLGSSIGIGKATSDAELDAALAEVFKYDDTAIVEPCVKDIMEINISVMDSEDLTASVTEIPVGTDGVLSYEDKYLKEGAGKKGKLQGAQESQGMASLSRSIDPEHLSDDIKKVVTGYALKLAKILGASGVGRFDFIVNNSDGSIYFNELNPIPGSFAFYLWEKSKPPVIYPQLINKMIDRALERKANKAQYEKDTGFKALFN